MTELEQLAEVCVRLGAGRAQAMTMAAQLLKRATQISAERGIARETALANLLELVIRAREGDVPPGAGPNPLRSTDEK